MRLWWTNSRPSVCILHQGAPRAIDMHYLTDSVATLLYRDELARANICDSSSS